MSDQICPPEGFPGFGPWGQRRGILGPWVACLWLAFLIPAFVDGWRDRDHLKGLLTMVLVVAFMVLYSIAFMGARRSRMRRLVVQPPVGWAVSYVGGLAVLAVAMIWSTGQDALVGAVFVAVATMMTLPLRLAVPTVTALLVTVLVFGHHRHWQSAGGIAFGTVLGSLVVFAMRTVMARNIQLWRANQENTLLAVDNERNRFARDLHDILGHSLTVITVKAELAQRLLDADPERAKGEIADLERLSRDALADVRRAVEGYRELTLPGELARAKAALRAAEIEPVVPGSTDDVPSQLRELFAWAVREGVTNVIRHSEARSCQILLSPTSAEIRDDGTGPQGCPEGSGLTGLRERAAAAGAVVTTRALEPGFSLKVSA